MERSRRWTLQIAIVIAMAVPAVAAEEGADIDLYLSLERNPRELAVEAIAAADESVQAVIYKFTDTQILVALQEAQTRGVKLRLLLDANEAAKSGSLWRSLAAAGADLRFWSRKQGKLHAKFVIIDRELALAGSNNWSVSGGNSNVELSFRLTGSGEIVELERIFDKLWQRASTTEP